MPVTDWSGARGHVLGEGSGLTGFVFAIAGTAFGVALECVIDVLT